jgi:hypothetical protein
MHCNVVHSRVEALLDSRKDECQASAVIAKQRSRSKPDIVPAFPTFLRFGNLSRACKPLGIGINECQPVRPAVWSAVAVVAFEKRLIIYRELNPQLLKVASRKKE